MADFEKFEMVIKFKDKKISKTLESNNIDDAKKEAESLVNDIGESLDDLGPWDGFSIHKMRLN